MNIQRKLIIAIIIAITFGQLTQADENTVVAGNTAFAFDLYRQLQTEGNLFFSPYSISSALAMTYAGARENTATQMSQVLHFAPDQTQFHPAFGDLQASINATQAKGDIALNVANSLWLQNSYPFRESFLELLQRYYQAEPKLVDFITLTIKSKNLSSQAYSMSSPASSSSMPFTSTVTGRHRLT